MQKIYCPICGSELVSYDTPGGQDTEHHIKHFANGKFDCQNSCKFSMELQINKF